MDRHISVRTHRSELGDWQLVTATPGKRARALVRRYAGYRERSPETIRRLEPASPAAIVIISFGPQLRVRDAATGPSGARELRSFIATPSAQWAVTEYDGRQDGVQVDLSPLALTSLLRTELDPIGTALGFEDVFGPPADGLVERLMNLPDWQQRFDAVEEFLCDRLDPMSVAPEVAWALCRIDTTRGRVSVETLARESGWSRRHLIARFRSTIGITPGRYRRVVRFRHALELMAKGGTSLAEIALAAGYFDQAHLDRDVRLFAGTSPSDLLARRLPDGFGISGA